MIQKKLVLACVVAACFAGKSYAQIPVTDGAQIGIHISNQVETIAKWASQFQQMKQQYDQAKLHYDAVRGARGMGGLLNATGVNISLPADWATAVNSFKYSAGFAPLRSQYPSFANTPKYNAMYDTIVVQKLSMDDFYKKANQRITQVSSLMAQIDSADDPAAKADLQNRIASEQNAIQANAQLVQLIKEKNMQDLEAAQREAKREFLCAEFKRACP